MLNKFKFAFAGAVVAAGLVSNAAYAAEATGTATVEIVTPVELSAVTTLNFGLVAADALAAGTVTIGHADNTQAVSTVKGFGSAARGSFQVTAAADGAVVDLAFDNATITLTDNAAVGADMTANLTMSASSITFDAAALETVYVGGTLDVGIDQEQGTYEGSFTVTANYQ